MPNFTRESGGTLHVAVMGVNRIGKVSSNFFLDYLWACFHEDVSQAMGLFGDLAESEESMFRSEAENDKWPTFTWHDVIMLRTLYDQRIKPGMPEDQAMPIVRVIIAELLAELNAPAE